MTVLIERLSHKQANVKSRIVEGEDGGKKHVHGRHFRSR